MNTYSNYTEAKQAADSFFNNTFGYTNGAGTLSERKTQISETRYQIEFFSLDDPGMDDTFKCIVDCDLHNQYLEKQLQQASNNIDAFIDFLSK